MNSKPTAAAPLLLIVLSVASPLRAAEVFEQVSATAFGIEGLFKGTRTEALGSADLAGARGAEAPLFNPAPVPTGAIAAAAYGQMEWIEGEFENLGLAAEWRSLRLGLVRTQYELSDQPLLIPGRSGDTFDVRTRFDVVGLSWNLLRTLAPEARPFWIVGGNYRRYSEHLASYRLVADTFDLGSTAGISWENPGYRLRVATALVWQNITDAEVDGPAHPTRVPRPLRYGTSVDVGATLGPRPWQRVDVRLALSGSHDASRREEDRAHLGAELGVGGLLYLRGGSDGVGSWNEISVGLGLRLDAGPLTVGVDWTRVELDSDVTDDPFDMFGARLGARL